MLKLITSSLIFISSSVFSQITSANNDSVKINKSVVVDSNKKIKDRYTLNPLTSSLLSTFIPGAGQIYNRKYWKAPIVWAGGLYLLYTYDGFKRKHSFYHQILIYKDRYTSNEYIIPYAEEYGSEFTNESAVTISEFSKGEIQLRNDQAKKRKNQVIVGALIFYLFQIVDATVDAHFSQFDVSEDLSLKISPAIFYSAPQAQGIKLSFGF